MDVATSNAAAGAPPPSLPDLNAQTYPAAVVQRLLDQRIYFTLYGVAAQGGAPGAEPGATGFSIALELHHYASSVRVAATFEATQEVGPVAAAYQSRWLFAPDDHPWSPDREPPPTRFDPARPQSFAMLGDLLRFGSSQRHGFSGYGMGRTYPDPALGPDRVLVGAVGNVTSGYGKFQGLEGTYVLNGALARGRGYEGLVICRMIDPQGVFASSGENHPPPPGQLAPPATYFIMAGQKAAETTPSQYGPPTGRPNLVSVVTSAVMRSVQHPFTDGGPGGLRGQPVPGDAVGELDATVTLDILAPPGTASAPNSFTTRNVYHFRDPQGREIGTFTAQLDGRSFALRFPAAPGQLGLRFGAVGRIVEGTGALARARGLVAVNSAIGLRPHVLSILHMVQLTSGAGETGTPPQAHQPGSVTSPAPAVSAGGAALRENDLVLRSGQRMHYRETGRREGRPILMLHGNPGHSHAWTPVLRELSDLGWCLAPDLIGFGASSKPREAPSFYHHARYLDEFVEGLGLRGVTLFIQDWGGALGFDHAVRHQDNVRAIAFFEAILKPYESWDVFPQKLDRAKLDQGDPQQFKSSLARQKFQEFRASREVGGPGWEQITVGNVFLKVFMGPLLGHPFDPRQIPEPEQDPVLGPLLEPYLKPFPTVWSRGPIWRLSGEIPIAGSPSDTTATVRHYSQVLARWDVPKLLIYSDKGPTLKEEHAEWVRQNWRTNLTVHCLDQLPGITVTEGTHFLQQTHPKEVAGFFREWFTRLG